MAPAKPHKPYPRVEFDYDKIPAKPAVEPPLPTSEAARNHAPNPYVNSQLTHEKIAAIRAKSTIPAKDALNVDYAQDAGLYPRLSPTSSAVGTVCASTSRLCSRRRLPFTTVRWAP